MSQLDLKLFEHVQDNPLLLKEYFFKYYMIHSEFNIANLCAYDSNVNYLWTMYKDRLLLYANNYDFLYPPIGEPLPIEDYLEISKAFKEQNRSGRFLLTRRDFIDKNPAILDFFEYTPRRDLVDYIYDVDALISLTGKKLQKKKNLINQFLALYPNHQVRPLKKEDRDICINLARKWYENKEQHIADDSEQKEKDALEKSFNCMEGLCLYGLAFFIDNEFVGFSIFSQQNIDTYTVHYEKFLNTYKGLAQFINKQTAIYIKQLGGASVNREQDLGIEGLRQAKMSYDPKLLIEVGLLTPH